MKTHLGLVVGQVVHAFNFGQILLIVLLWPLCRDSENYCESFRDGKKPGRAMATIRTTAPASSCPKPSSS